MKESEAVMNEPPSPSFATQESEARLLRIDEVSAIVGLKRTTIWHRCNPDSPYYDASFPKPIRIGSRWIAWNSRDIQTWIAAITAQGHSG
ncbi:helix-turn-helix transcriptional regulator [Cardiobacterium valvarum]|uniref:Predicted transcriptional regulator n=1 Tax=Cardiobacterium valvarum TaxID=194702 RepID=A0A381E5X2_9GAMM|nr:AlpA family phage regulatory protein [Cardiobacterium valvarum]SUX21910.1 Predicted transcriptional regulator [Cardiobacterium valvarum]